MKVEREVIVDLLPAYFSGEASAATQALVEEAFHEDPEFERQVRRAELTLESLKNSPLSLAQEKEKLALERGRQLAQTRLAYFWVAAIFSALLPAFRLHDGKIVWLFWEPSPIPGMIFAALAGFFWLFYLRIRGRSEPLPGHTVFTWLAAFYTLMLALFRIQDHKIVWLAWSSAPTIGIVFATIAGVLWIISFVIRYKTRADAGK